MSSGKAGEKKSIKFISFLVRAIFKTFCLALRLFYMRSNNYGLFLGPLVYINFSRPEANRTETTRFTDLPIPTRYVPDTYPIRTGSGCILFTFGTEQPTFHWVYLWCPGRRFHLFIILCILSIYLFYSIPSTHPPIRPAECLTVWLTTKTYVCSWILIFLPFCSAAFVLFRTLFSPMQLFSHSRCINWVFLPFICWHLFIVDWGYSGQGVYNLRLYARLY